MAYENNGVVYQIHSGRRKICHRAMLDVSLDDRGGVEHDMGKAEFLYEDQSIDDLTCF